MTFITTGGGNVHLLTFCWITFDHLVVWLEAGPGYLIHPKLLMIRLVSAGHRGVGGQGVVDPEVGHQVGL